MPAGGALEEVGRDPLQVVQVQALGLEGERFVLSLPGEIDFIFVTTGELKQFVLKNKPVTVV